MESYIETYSEVLKEILIDISILYQPFSEQYLWIQIFTSIIWYKANIDTT